MNSNGDLAERRKAFDKDREDRERAAAEYKAARNIAAREAPPRIKSNENTRKERVDSTQMNGANNKDSDRMEIDSAVPAKTPTLATFDIKTVPAEVAQWLEISGFYNEEYRNRELERCNKILELQRQMDALQQQGFEDRSRITRGPSMLSAQPMTVAASAPSASLVR